MKKTLVFIFLVMFFTICYSINLNFELKNYYSDNILQLSENAKDEFIDSLKSDKYHIYSLDDIISNFKAEIQYKHRFFFKHTQKIKFYLKYDKFYYNPIKDNFSLGISLKQYFNKNINVIFSYSYFPHIYVNHYQSVLEENIYREFTYAKNVYYSLWNVKILKPFSMKYKFEFSQLYYNKYFTEYDAENILHEFGIDFVPAKIIKFNLSYGFRKSAALGTEAYKKHPEITDFKDPSYEANLFKTDLKFVDLFVIDNKKVSLKIGFDYQEKYYQSELFEDKYHYCRDEFIRTIEFIPEIVFNQSAKLSVFYKYNIRTERSPFNSVIEDKEYENYQIGLGFEYLIGY